MTIKDNNIIDVTLPNYGTLRGLVDQARQVAIFRNVPYAIVPERWRAAVKVEPWSGVRDATEQGPVCPQQPSTFALNLLLPKDAVPTGKGKYEFGLDHDEKNCLNLNIFVPLQALNAPEGTEPIPVLTWIHGGAFQDGSNGLPLYDAINFVEHSIQLQQPVIVVTVNYRLNVFGFLASKELEQDAQEYYTANSSPTVSYDQSVGNWGLMDQKLAFQWVRENISAFGGNTKNVIAWGESAGSISIHYHMLLPSHHGLFDHAIMQSGTVSTISPMFIHTDGQLIFDTLLTKLNIPLDLDSKEKLKRLRAVPSEELSIVGQGIAAKGYGPFYDGGKVIPSKVPIQVLAKDLSAYDPGLKSVLIGANKDEGSAFTGLFGNHNLQTWPHLLNRFIPDPQMAALFQSVYGNPETDADVTKIIGVYTGDFKFTYTTQVLVDTFKRLDQQRSEAGFKVIRYHFDAATEKMEQLVPGLGAMHAGELPYIFLPPAVEKVLVASELALGKEMQKIWISFANQKDVAVKSADTMKTPVLENDEAILIGADRQITLGKSDRLPAGVLNYWNKISHFAEQKEQSVLSAST
ncbi:hypothetical protein BX616_004182 [Lobosporangium transversale]|uniref:Alpha/Beta hydrolase protein n=1 Tax=Lobosporangium transversale TaxID=64571 RepID=A0A1Y2GC63_9FUNG|nr:Alpha/Beta hydrolase protein [Lobosporangium transversale]KAF9898322.1 hypothetical protein BX616_004182 [Lobosporangium transversale]ORZ06785.1 Alpha/Beta hydrolase protein [Lobosporangium transversale]|eukprot:XP_021877706.1 Alpha/Beta hydrolase protein [Lobosporangium transversale]